mgnify:CR=1 FL=1
MNAVRGEFSVATIKDIATEAGVSIATVSRALNNHPAVNETTRISILQVAERLKYPIESIQQKQHIGRSVLIIVRKDKGDETPEKRDLESSVWHGVQTALDNTNIATRLQQSHLTLEEARQYVSDVSVSGLILLGGLVNHDFVDYLAHHNLPFVVAGARVHGVQSNAVMADVSGGMRQVVEHLVTNGRQYIGFVNGPEDTMTSVEKLDALRFILYSHNIPFQPHQLTTSNFSSEEGYRQTHRLIEQMGKPDAIVYADDSIALGGIRALQERGMSIPEDVAITGFGDYEIARFMSPSLTTVRFDMAQMGRIAARRLKMLLDEPDKDTWLVRVPTELIIRDSA